MKLNISQKVRRFGRLAWRPLVLLAGTSWLFAPTVNHQLNTTTTLISQYEAGSQTWSWLFRSFDILAGLAVIFLAYRATKRRRLDPLVGWLIVVVGAGGVLDAIFATSCNVQSHLCYETTNLFTAVHGAETLATGAALFIASVVHARRSKIWPSLFFFYFQLLYFVLFFLTSYSGIIGHRSVSQFLYQGSAMLWVIWVLGSAYRTREVSSTSVRHFVGYFIGLNGLISVLIGVVHLPNFGVFQGLFFANDTSWLAEHSVIAGMMILYLSRQLLRGEVNARRLMLIIFGGEIIKYSLITPQALVLGLYLLSFVLLFIAEPLFVRRGSFRRPSVRIEDSLKTILIGGIGFVGMLGVGEITSRYGILPERFDRYLDLSLNYAKPPRMLLHYALTIHTINAFIAVSLAILLWSIFRPSKPLINEHDDRDHLEARALLQTYSHSSEDYFKLWPLDKQYYWTKDHSGFIAYRVVGGIAYALADPICEKSKLAKLRRDFIDYCRNHGWRACFLILNEKQKKSYEAAGLRVIGVGSSAVINIKQFCDQTARDKWWRWQTNRALKQGYSYSVSAPEHDISLLDECMTVSTSWLARENHREQGFVLGYFDEKYLGDCYLHLLRDAEGRLVAFANELPIFAGGKRTTVDLIRYMPSSEGAMPALLSSIIKHLGEEKEFSEFDLGFVPLAGVEHALARIAKTLARSRFSAEGLQQFKGKFDPTWEANYFAYDGDTADLALIALNLEKLMAV